MPHVKRLDRVMDIVSRLVEENVADATSQHDAEGRPNEEIVNILPSNKLWRPARERQAVAPADQQPDNISQGVPADRKRPERDRNRVYRRKWDRKERHTRYENCRLLLPFIRGSGSHAKKVPRRCPTGLQP